MNPLDLIKVLAIGNSFRHKEFWQDNAKARIQVGVVVSFIVSIFPHLAPDMVQELVNQVPTIVAGIGSYQIGHVPFDATFLNTSKVWLCLLLVCYLLGCNTNTSKLAVTRPQGLRLVETVTLRPEAPIYHYSPTSQAEPKYPLAPKPLLIKIEESECLPTTKILTPQSPTSYEVLEIKNVINGFFVGAVCKF